MKDFFLVVVESPYAGDKERNLKYAKRAMMDCFGRGEAPFASHVLYTQEGLLNDDDPEDREMGIAAGLSWGQYADFVAVYRDYGISPGMEKGISKAREYGLPVIYREIGTNG